MHKLRLFACFCLASAASKTFFNGLSTPDNSADSFQRLADIK
jgi:hypothetical protein